MHTSYSALETFEVCPLKYKYQEINKIKTPKRVEQVFGTVIHSALKYMFERNPLYPTLDEVIDFYTGKWQEAAEKIAWRDENKKEQEEKMYFEQGVAMIKHFYAKNKPWQFHAVELESRFSIELVDEETQTTHSLAGIIDRIDKDPESEQYEIIDYKTGKKMPSQEMVEENLQLGVYSLALVRRWPHIDPKNITTSLYFLKHNDKVSAPHSNKKLERAKERVLTIIKEIERRIEEDDFPPTPGPLCSFCPFRNICPMWAHEYISEEEKKTPTEEELANDMREFFAIKEEEEKNKKRVAELRERILAYMNEKGLERVFGSGGYITKTEQDRVSFDMEEIQPLLEEIGKWSAVNKPDPKLLEKLLPSLPHDLQEKIRKYQKKSKTITLRQTKK